MAKYCVEVAELHKSLMMIEASSEEEAIEKVEEGGGDEFDCQYDYTLESDYWTVKKLD